MTITVPDNAAATKVLEQVSTGGGFATVTLGDLKEVVGVTRLGKYVLADIATWLRRQGLGYFPRNVLDNNPEPRQHTELRIYRAERTSPLTALIDAVTEPNPEGDRLLGTLTSNSSAQRAQELQERIARAKAALEDALAELTPDEAGTGADA